MIEWHTDQIDAALFEMWELRAKLDFVQYEIMQAEGPTMLGLMTRAAAATAGFATEISPYLYGVLASAHRSLAEPISENEVLGLVYISKHVVHPVLGGRPYIYGREVHERKPWMRDAAIAMEEEVVGIFEEGMIVELESLF